MIVGYYAGVFRRGGWFDVSLMVVSTFGFGRGGRLHYGEELRSFRQQGQNCQCRGVSMSSGYLSLLVSGCLQSGEYPFEEWRRLLVVSMHCQIQIPTIIFSASMAAVWLILIPKVFVPLVAFYVSWSFRIKVLIRQMCVFALLLCVLFCIIIMKVVFHSPMCF